MNPRTVLSGSILLLAATLACNLGAPARTAAPDLEATITAQAQALEARTLAPSVETAAGTLDTPTTLAANPTQPSAPNATSSPKSTKTARPTPTVTNTPVPTLSVPQTPGNLTGSTVCPQDATNVNGDYFWQVVVTLTWQDSDTETAYRLYRNGTAYTTVVVQDATSWPVYVEYRYNQNNAIEYEYFELEAYNSAGTSDKAEAYVFHCHY